MAEKEEETPPSQENRVEGHHPGSGNRRPGVDKRRAGREFQLDGKFPV